MRTKAECKKDSIRLGGRGGMKSHVWLMILPVLTVSTLPYQVYGQTEVKTTEFLAVIDPR